MKSRKFCACILIIAFTLLFGCSGSTKQDFPNRIDDGINLPLPQFDIELEHLRNEYKKRYKAKEVRLSRSYFYASEDDNSYWIKIAFLNPDLENKTVREFGKEVALATLRHLTNPEDFEKIEIAVTQKTGFIITFSKNENAFFYLDSLVVQ
jgi:hypothetical protein